MSKRWMVVLLGTLCLVVLLAAGCTRPKPPVEATTAGTATVEPRAPTDGTPAVVPTGATVISAGPTPTYEMPTLTPSPGLGATPTSLPTAQPSPTLAVSPTPAPVQHTVQWGDTVYSLARQYGTTVEAIAQANNLPPSYLIRVGQTLTIPGQPVSSNVYVVKPGDTLYSIAARYGVAWQTLASVNRILNPALLQVGQQLIIPEGGTAAPEGAKTHIVKQGETLYRIALTYGTTVQAIALANNLSNVHIIYPGQQLLIP